MKIKLAISLLLVSSSAFAQIMHDVICPSVFRCVGKTVDQCIPYGGNPDLFKKMYPEGQLQEGDYNIYYVTGQHKPVTWIPEKTVCRYMKQQGESERIYLNAVYTGSKQIDAQVDYPMQHWKSDGESATCGPLVGGQSANSCKFMWWDKQRK